jgi:methionyl-tRNA formyltransferase
LLLRNASGGRLHCTPDFTQFDAPLLHCSDINDAHVITALSNTHYRTIILAQSGIVRDALLALPDKWIVNAHPGKLPEFRGVDVVKWALWHKAPLEVTLHIVRKGVDTGEVLKAVQVAVQAGDSITDIEGRAAAISIQLLLEAAMKGKEGFGDPQKQPKSTGNQYYLMPYSMVRRLRAQWPEIRTKYVADK